MFKSFMFSFSLCLMSSSTIFSYFTNCPPLTPTASTLHSGILSMWPNHSGVQRLTFSVTPYSIPSPLLDILKLLYTFNIFTMHSLSNTHSFLPGKLFLLFVSFIFNSLDNQVSPAQVILGTIILSHFHDYHPSSHHTTLRSNFSPLNISFSRFTFYVSMLAQDRTNFTFFFRHSTPNLYISNQS